MAARSSGAVAEVALVATGTRGEVLPFLALAAGLQASGFRVTVATHAVHARLVRRHGVGFVPLRGDPQSVMQSAAFADAVMNDATLNKAVNLVNEAVHANLVPNMELLHAACKDADAILCGVTQLTECSAIGQRYQIPVILCPHVPFSPSAEIPLAVYASTPSRFGWINRLSFELAGRLLWSTLGREYNLFRTQTLGIGPQNNFTIEGVPQVAAFSELLVPRPADWGAHIHYSAGHWALPPAVAAAGLAELQPTLAALLAAAAAPGGRRPIFVGFESFPVPEPVSFLRLLHAMAGALDAPVVFASGATDMAAVRSSALLEGLGRSLVWEEPAPPRPLLHGDVSSASLAAAGPSAALAPAEAAAAAGLEYGDYYGDDVLAAAARAAAAAATGTAAPAAAATAAVVSGVRLVVVREAPYGWVLPRCALAVHAGGAAVTQAACHAGVPSAVFPVHGEGFFWAARVAALRVGPAAAHPVRLLHARIEAAVAEALEPAVAARAAALGEALRARGDGVASAVAAVRDVLARPQHRNCGLAGAWAPDVSADGCTVCGARFGLTVRRRHCRSCGRVACHDCLARRCHLPGFPETAPQICCAACLAARAEFLAAHPAEGAVPPLPAAVSAPPSLAAGAGAGGRLSRAVPMRAPSGGAPRPATATGGPADAVPMSMPSASAQAAAGGGRGGGGRDRGDAAGGLGSPAKGGQVGGRVDRTGLFSSSWATSGLATFAPSAGSGALNPAVAAAATSVSASGLLRLGGSTQDVPGIA